MRNKKILLTGGGTAGHVFPHYALFPELKKHNFQIHYIGSYNGIERDLIKKQKIPYTPILTGKFRRYFSIKNFFDVFSFLLGTIQALFYLFLIRPKVVFSKGGYVTVPVIIASFLYRIPVIIHESDLTMGLANRIASVFATQICFTFEESLTTVYKRKRHKYQTVGALIRKEIFEGSKNKGLKFCNWKSDSKLKTLLVMGGSLGAKKINDQLEQILPILKKKNWRIIHLCGKGKINFKEKDLMYYVPFEFVNNEFKDILALADVVISRAGSGSIFELLSTQTPNLLIPLSKKFSRGDQILNADIFKRKGYSQILQEEELSQESLTQKIEELWTNKKNYKIAMNKNQKHGVDLVLNLLLNSIE